MKFKMPSCGVRKCCAYNLVFRADRFTSKHPLDDSAQVHAFEIAPWQLQYASELTERKKERCVYLELVTDINEPINPYEAAVLSEELAPRPTTFDAAHFEDLAENWINTLFLFVHKTKLPQVENFGGPI